MKNVFLLRLKTDGKEGRDRTKEALDRDEVWIGWRASSLAGKALSCDEAFEKAKKLGFDVKAAKQIALFVGDMHKGDLVIVTQKGGREYFAAEIVENECRPTNVQWDKSPLPGRRVNWLNWKKPRPTAGMPVRMIKVLSRNCTVFSFKRVVPARNWANRMGGLAVQSQANEKNARSRRRSYRQVTRQT